MVDGMVLQLGDESGDVDGVMPRPLPPGRPTRCPCRTVTWSSCCTRPRRSPSARRSTGWTTGGCRAHEPRQHRSDLAADAAELDVLGAADVGVLSEESGLHAPERDSIVVVDPLDGSTNAACGIPWFATSLCAVDRDGPRVAPGRPAPRAHVHRRARRGSLGRRRGARAHRAHRAGRSRRRHLVAAARVARGGSPGAGAVALDLCAVAEGTLDGHVDASSPSAHGAWDYPRRSCAEAGAVVADALGRDLNVLDPATRRTPVAAGTMLNRSTRQGRPGGERWSELDGRSGHYPDPRVGTCDEGLPAGLGASAALWRRWDRATHRPLVHGRRRLRHRA